MHAGKARTRNKMYGFASENKLCFRREYWGLTCNKILKESWYSRDELPEAALKDGWPKGFVTKACKGFDEKKGESSQ